MCLCLVYFIHFVRFCWFLVFFFFCFLPSASKEPNAASSYVTLAINVNWFFFSRIYNQQIKHSFIVSMGPLDVRWMIKSHLTWQGFHKYIYLPDHTSILKRKHSAFDSFFLFFFLLLHLFICNRNEKCKFEIDKEKNSSKISSSEIIAGQITSTNVVNRFHLLISIQFFFLLFLFGYLWHTIKHISKLHINNEIRFDNCVISMNIYIQTERSKPNHFTRNLICFRFLYYLCTKYDETACVFLSVIFICMILIKYWRCFRISSHTYACSV